MSANEKKKQRTKNLKQGTREPNQLSKLEKYLSVDRPPNRGKVVIEGLSNILRILYGIVIIILYFRRGRVIFIFTFYKYCLYGIPDLSSFLSTLRNRYNTEFYSS